MRRSQLVLVPIALLAGLACQPRVASPVYGPWEEGLTLVYEDPSLPYPQREAERMQVRVARSTLAPGAPGLVQLDLTSLKDQTTTWVKHHEGGIDRVDESGQVQSVILPVHFPEVPAWVDHGIQFQVIGRAAWEGAAILPATSDAIGIWVEARSPQDRRLRVLYLPNLGAVESRVERSGTWVVVQRLVARGFTDLPASRRP
jgi:hypothetical protein